MRTRIALWLFIVASLGLTIWGAWSYANPSSTCRGELMGPGDVCHYASPSSESTDRIQTYEERIWTMRQQLPFVIGVGAAATIFGVVLLVRSGKQGHGAVDDPILLHERDLGDSDV